MIAAASLSTRARIERPQLDAVGAPIGLVTWIDAGGVWLSLEPAGETRATDAVANTAHAFWRVRVRTKGPKIEVGWRLRIGARTLMVRALHHNVEWLDCLLCEETHP